MSFHVRYDPENRTLDVGVENKIITETQRGLFAEFKNTTKLISFRNEQDVVQK